MCAEKERIITAVAMAAESDLLNLTCDRLEALAAGHGQLNMALYCAANVVAEEIRKGVSPKVKFANERKQPVDDILRGDEREEDFSSPGL